MTELEIAKLKKDVQMESDMDGGKKEDEFLFKDIVLENMRNKNVIKTNLTNFEFEQKIS